ncbi:MAG: DinB family protein [Pseudomonadota bacterium]
MIEREVINTLCPWSGDPVSPDSLTHYRGRKVGFCNPGCRDKFEAATALFDGTIGTAQRDPALVILERAARYNCWFNDRLFEAIARLDLSDYSRNAGAFFGSVEASVNHILVWDIVWLQRIARSLSSASSLAWILTLETPTANDQVLHKDLAQLSKARRRIDATIIALTSNLKTKLLEQRVSYQRQSGAAFEHALDEVLQHMFNHQTHHRGQVTTLLSQASIDPGVTDMIAMVIDEDAAEKIYD